MSTKTNFKRIALVAVASLGLGLMSTVPSQAAVSSTLLTPANGTATTTVTDSTTAATVSLSALYGAVADSVTVSLIAKPGTSLTAFMGLVETTTTQTLVETGVSTATAGANQRTRTQYVIANFLKAGSTIDQAGSNARANYVVYMDTAVTTSGVGYVGAKFRIELDTVAAGLTAGTHEYSVIFKSFDNGVYNAAKDAKADVSIVVGVPASAVKTVNGALSSVTVGDTTANLAGTTSTTSDSTIAVASTASATDVAVVRVRLRNASNGNAQESITASISAGRIGDGSTIMGRNVTLAYTSTDVSNGYKDLVVEADGTAGTGTIVIAATSYTFPAKTVTFYADTTDKITAAAYASVIGSSGIGVHGSQFDAAGNSWGAGTALYAYSSDTATISSYGSACTYNSTLKVALCTLTGVKNGTANITLRDAATVALSTKVSNAVAVKVNINAAATVALDFNKTTYAPGEKATLKITVKDAAGAVLPAQTYSNLFATGGLTTSASIGSAISGTLLSNVSVVTMATVAASTDTPLVTLDPIGQVTFYMPLAGGTVTVSGKGGTSLPAAGQVTVSTSATVTDSGAAALAAVTALATTVASLKTLITTLTNLVLKIQKKVKA